MPNQYKDWVLIIPSIRKIRLDYLRHVPREIPIFVVDDSNGKIKPSLPNMKVFDYADQKKVMGRNYDLIPHKTAACRNFAFYYIWKYTDYKYVLTLDDDCVTQKNFMEAYGSLGKKLQLKTAITKGWYNTIDLFSLREKIYARGYPYWERYEKKIFYKQTKSRVVCNMGMWSNVLDTDAFDKSLFSEYIRKYPHLKLKHGRLRVGTKQRPTHFSFCAMNFGFIREILPIMYQMPMCESFANKYDLWRFDDIWAGYIIQSIIHKKGDAITIGAPIVKHSKFGNLRKELNGEHYGHLISPYFYEVIDEAISNLSCDHYAEMYISLFDYILKHAKKIKQNYNIPDLYWKYILDVSTKCHRWGKLFLKDAK